MADDDREGERHSRALSPEIITDPEEKARREAANWLRQFDVAMDILEEWRVRNAKFRLRMPTVLTLHRTALEGLSAFAGNFRPAGVEIEGSKHEPVGAHQVPDLVQDMCDYVNENWDAKTAIHLAAYVMWRLNWIHPFDDGNGRPPERSPIWFCVLTSAHACPAQGRFLTRFQRTRPPITRLSKRLMRRGKKITLI